MASFELSNTTVTIDLVNGMPRTQEKSAVPLWVYGAGCTLILFLFATLAAMLVCVCKIAVRRNSAVASMTEAAAVHYHVNSNPVVRFDDLGIMTSSPQDSSQVFMKVTRGPAAEVENETSSQCLK